MLNATIAVKEDLLDMADLQEILAPLVVMTNLCEISPKLTGAKEVIAMATCMDRGSCPLSFSLLSCSDAFKNEREWVAGAMRALGGTSEEGWLGWSVLVGELIPAISLISTPPSAPPAEVPVRW